MMSMEGPYLTALIARLAEPEYNLAAYGVAFSIALIVESPVIMMLSASTALVEDKNSFLKLRNFVYTVNAILIIVMIVLIFPPIYNFFTIQILNLPLRVAELTHTAIIILIPWAPAIGYRRFHQGILIRNNMTRKVAYGTIIRLLAMSAIALVLFLFSDLHGVIIGASALSSGVIAEAIATKLMLVNTIKKIKADENPSREITYSEIIKFYFPLLLTSFITLAMHPVVTFFMGFSYKSLESLAVLPVLNSLVFIFRSFGLSYQEVGIALLKSKQGYVKLRNFAIVMGVLVVIALGLVSFTFIGEIWLSSVAGLSDELTKFSELPLMLFTIFPALTVWINFQRAVLVNKRKTKPITYATIIEISGVVLMLILTITYFNFIGVIGAVIAYTFGRLAADIYLIFPFNKARNEILNSNSISQSI